MEIASPAHFSSDRIVQICELAGIVFASEFASEATPKMGCAQLNAVHERLEQRDSARKLNFLILHTLSNCF